MKVGFSYSRCLLDIVEGKVGINDIAVIITATNFNPENEDEWSRIWKGYSATIWGKYNTDDYKTEFKRITLSLFNSGKIHQPRKFGVNRYRSKLSNVWFDLIPTNEEIQNNPSLKLAWDKLQFLSNIANLKTIYYE